VTDANCRFKMVYASDDGGQSWQHVGSPGPMQWPQIFSCASGAACGLTLQHRKCMFRWTGEDSCWKLSSAPYSRDARLSVFVPAGVYIIGCQRLFSADNNIVISRMVDGSEVLALSVQPSWMLLFVLINRTAACLHLAVRFTCFQLSVAQGARWGVPVQLTRGLSVITINTGVDVSAGRVTKAFEMIPRHALCHSLRPPVHMCCHSQTTLQMFCNADGAFHPALSLSAPRKASQLTAPVRINISVGGESSSWRAPPVVTLAVQVGGPKL
jgi:hypothetical protein